MKSKKSKVKHTFFTQNTVEKEVLSRFETISFSTLIIAQLFLNGFMLQVMNLIRYKNKSKLGKALTLTYSRSY